MRFVRCAMGAAICTALSMAFCNTTYANHPDEVQPQACASHKPVPHASQTQRVDQSAVNFVKPPEPTVLQKIAQDMAGNNAPVVIEGTETPRVVLSVAEPSVVAEEDIPLACCAAPKTWAHRATLTFTNPTPDMFDRLGLKGSHFLDHVRAICITHTNDHPTNTIFESLFKLNRFTCLKHLTWQLPATCLYFQNCKSYRAREQKRKFPKGAPSLEFCIESCFIAVHKNLQSLNLREIRSSGIGYEANPTTLSQSGLGQLQHLRALTLGSLSFTQNEIDTIALLKNLEKLDLKLHHMPKGSSTDSWAQLQKLTDVKLIGVNKNEHIAFVLQLPNLATLTLPVFRAGDFAILEACCTIKTLRLYHCKLNAQNVQVLPLPQQLEVLDCSNEPYFVGKAPYFIDKFVSFQNSFDNPGITQSELRQTFPHLKAIIL